MANFQLSEHFNAKEFVCKCGKCNMSSPEYIYKNLDPKLPEKLEQVRLALNTPMIITSGARCKGHHVSIYKRRYGDSWEQNIVWHSQHLQLKAADFTCNYKLFKAAMICAYFRFSGVGWYQRNVPKEGLIDYFIHSDVGDGSRFYRKIYSF